MSLRIIFCRNAPIAMRPLPEQARISDRSAFSTDGAASTSGTRGFAVIPASASVIRAPAGPVSGLINPGVSGDNDGGGQDDDNRLDDRGSGKKSRGHGARLTGLRAKLAALAVKHRQDGNQSGGPPAPTGITGLDARLGGGLPWGGVHELVVARAGDRAAMTGFALALAARLIARPLSLEVAGTGPMPVARRDGEQAGAVSNHFLWVYPRRLAQEAGLPYGPGLMAFGHDPGRFVLVETAASADVLRVVEDALTAGPLRAVFALVDDTYGARAFTASRRFALAARTSGTSVFLLGGGGETRTSAAQMRWQVAPLSAPSRLASGPAPFPFRASWQVELIRNRFGANGAWALEWDHGTGAFSQITGQPAPESCVGNLHQPAPGVFPDNLRQPAPPPGHP